MQRPKNMLVVFLRANVVRSAQDQVADLALLEQGNARHAGLR
jgi:hypothetical protein